jgi:hypothetical protein
MQSMHSVMARRNQDKAQRYLVAKTPTPIESFSFNSADFQILLKYLDDKLVILEETPITPKQFSYQSYADARMFLKTFFIFLRILLDDLSGILEYFYKANERINLPSSFNDLQKKVKQGELPELYKLLEPTFLWFPAMRDTRNGLVHLFDSILLSFKQGANEKNIVGHF